MGDRNTPIYQNRYMLFDWWLTYPSEKYEFVSWDDEIPNIWKNTIHIANHQPVIVYVIKYSQN